jgi:hypothetical protein
MQFLGTLLSGLLITVNTIAQPYTFYNSSPIDSSRYDDIKRNPFLYDTWAKAKITNRAGLAYENVLINFNGYEQTFEVYQNNKQLTIDDNLYDEFTVNVNGIDEWFIRGVHYDLATELANIIYRGPNITLIRFFSVRLDETIKDSPGESLVTRRFADSRTYAILFSDKLTPTRLTANNIGKAVGAKEQIKNIIQKENINVRTEKGAIKLLTLFEN